jgi:hypothetical protein
MRADELAVAIATTQWRETCGDRQEQMRADAELLEDAAKAAGFAISFDEDGDSYRVKRSGNRDYWNPLSYDGDALRLAVVLWIEVRLFNGRAHAGRQNQFWCTELLDGNSYEATRRAIVRAAAEIGRAIDGSETPSAPPPAPKPQPAA